MPAHLQSATSRNGVAYWRVHNTSGVLAGQYLRRDDAAKKVARLNRKGKR